MSKKYVALCALLAVTLALSASIQGQDGRSIVTAAARAMGAENLRSVLLTGSGSNAGIGQNLNPGTAWPTVRVKTYTRGIDLEAVASAAQLVRIQNNAEQTQNAVIQPNAPWAQQYDFWITPYGFLKGALANPVTLRSDTVNGVKYNVVTFTLQNRYKVEGYINEQNMVERVRTWIDNNVMCDMLVEATYTDYKDFGGLKAPGFMIVKQGGYPTLIVGVNDAKANVPVTIPAPQAAAAPVPQQVLSEKIADGVWYLRSPVAAQNHHSVLVEFADHVAVIEAPQSEERSLAVIAEVAKLVPNKPIRYLINTHHHFDHSGGLRTYVDHGATIVTHDVNKPFYERVLAGPRTLNPDRLEASKKKPVIEITGDKKVMTDATRTLELHLIKANPHNDGILMAFLPKEKLIVQVDMYTPPAAGAAAPAANAPVNPNAAALLDNLEKLRLDFETILPLHGPGKVTRADLYAFVRKPLVPVSSLPDPAAAPARGGRGGAAAGPADPADAAIFMLMNSACTACHNMDRVQSQRLTAQGWQQVVTRMKGRGAAVPDAQVPALVAYLAKTYAP